MSTMTLSVRLDTAVLEQSCYRIAAALKDAQATMAALAVDQKVVCDALLAELREHNKLLARLADEGFRLKVE